MFTGIIEEVGAVGSVRRGGKSIVMEVKAQRVLDGTRVGDSIAVDGVCLTVTAIHDRSFSVDVMPETVNLTTLRLLKPGSNVNLERALRLSDRLGGHLVAGHIDGTGKITERRRAENAEYFRIETGAEILRFIVPKGSIAVDGISLTVVDTARLSFSVSLIPHTQGVTTFRDKRLGDEVNLECDVIGKYVDKLMNAEPGGGGVTLEILAKNGFL